MAAEGADPALVQKFVSITGADESRAEAFLNACNGNLEMAIGMHLEEDTEGANASGSHVQNVKQSVESDRGQLGEEDVRAPIPQTRGVLLEGPYRASRPTRRGNQSVFDAFRDFQAEARQQELELSGRAGQTKCKTLQDLFKPPLDIMHKGTFDTAKIAGEQEKKWLMVNIQDSKEFSCQQLNRDVWSNEAVRSIMANHFILWQVYHDSDDGDRYTQFYHVSNFPHLAILDPRTGEKLVEWDGVDAQSFCENAAGFLSSHSLGHNTNCLSSPAKRRKRESIIDASEDSQLEAAIAASLKETSADLRSSDDDKNANENADEGSLTDFSESESENDSKIVDEKNDEKDAFKNKENLKSSENRRETERNSTVEKDTKGNENNTGSDSKEEDVTKSKEEGIQGNPDESEEDDVDSGFPRAALMLRYPNGRRKLKTFAAEATILDLVKYVEAQGFSNERYELVTNFPRKKLSYLNSELSLKDAGLFPRETVFIQER